MDWDVVNVQVTGAHTRFVRFRDGVQGEMQFKPSFFQGVFSRLADQKAFEDVRLVDGVVTWLDELDWPRARSRRDPAQWALDRRIAQLRHDAPAHSFRS
jgi:hypothetical protein